MLLVTYSSDHNHPCRQPASRKDHQKPTAAINNNSTVHEVASTLSPDDKFPDGSVLLTGTDEFAWLGEMETTSSAILDSPIFRDNGSVGEVDLFMRSPTEEEEEEDESLFADLGELPECSMVFRHRNVGSLEIC